MNISQTELQTEIAAPDTINDYRGKNIQQQL